jgi:hypothetical protein
MSLRPKLASDPGERTGRRRRAAAGRRRRPRHCSPGDGAGPVPCLETHRSQRQRPRCTPDAPLPDRAPIAGVSSSVLQQRRRPRPVPVPRAAAARGCLNGAAQCRSGSARAGVARVGMPRYHPAAPPPWRLWIRLWPQSSAGLEPQPGRAGPPGPPAGPIGPMRWAVPLAAGLCRSPLGCAGQGLAFRGRPSGHLPGSGRSAPPPLRPPAPAGSHRGRGRGRSCRVSCPHSRSRHRPSHPGH